MKLTMTFFTGIEKKKTIKKFLQSSDSVIQNNLEKEKQSWGHHTFWLKLYYKGVVIKIVWCWHRNRHIGYCNRTTHKYVQTYRVNWFLTYEGGHWTNDCSKMMLGKLYLYMQKNDIGHLPYILHKNQLLMGKRPKCETWHNKISEREHRGKAHEHCLWQWFLGYQMKNSRYERKSKWDGIQLKDFSIAQ